MKRLLIVMLIIVMIALLLFAVAYAHIPLFRFHANVLAMVYADELRVVLGGVFLAFAVMFFAAAAALMESMWWHE